MSIPQPKWNEIKAKHIKSVASRKIVGVVLHCTAGSGTHNDTKYLANPGDGRRVSVDFTIERDGSIWRLIPYSGSSDLSKTYGLHAGRATAFKGLRNGQVTQGTVGIEFCQHHKLALTPIWPAEQVRAGAELCAWLTDKYKLTTSDITTHRAIVTDGSRSDPRLFPFEGPNAVPGSQTPAYLGFWQYYWQAKGKGESFDASTKIQKTPEADEDYYVVEKGDGWLAIARKLKLKTNGVSPTADELAALNGTTTKGALLIGAHLKIR